MSILNLAILVLAAFGTFVFYSRFKERQAEEEDREDLRTLTIRSRRSPTEARFRIQRYAEEARGVVERDGSGDPIVLEPTPPSASTGEASRFDEPGGLLYRRLIASLQDASSAARGRPRDRGDMMTGSCWTSVLTVVGAVVVTTLAVGPARAQETAPDEATPEVGSRVRVTTDGATEPVVGWIDARSGEGIHLVRASDHAVVPLSLDGIHRLEVSRVRRSGGARSAPGILVGGLAGLAIGAAVTEEHSCDPNSLFCFDFGSEKVMAGMLGASVGALVGGLVTWAVLPAESWTEVPVASLRLAADPGGGGVALAVTLPWRRIP